MANPNINTATNVYANNASLSLTTTSATQLASNAASSGKVYLIDSVIVSNITGTAATIIVAMYNSATNTGTAYEIMPTISVPANSAVTLGKNEGLSLLENESLYCTAGTANAIKVTAFWKELS